MSRCCTRTSRRWSQAFIERKRFVYLCTNGVLHAAQARPVHAVALLRWVVHIDGLRERHDDVGRAATGCSTRRSSAIREAKEQGFRVTTNSTFFNTDSPETVREVLDFLNDELEVDAMMISPGYAYEKAPDQEHFLGVEQTQRLFRDAFADGRRRTLAAQPHRRCSSTSSRARWSSSAPRGAIPSYSVFGWQRPCYLMADGYTATYRELIETTDWDRYGRGHDPTLRQLHGALRLRADGGVRDDGFAARVAAGRGVDPLSGPVVAVLDAVAGPADLRGLDAAALDQLADELREAIVESVAANGGHLGSNLGAVELTLALHRVFDSPATRSSGTRATRPTCTSS